MINQLSGKRYRNILGKKIKILRKIRGKTQVELGRELGFTSTGAISQVENGLRGLTIDPIMKAARALSVHPIVLLMPYDMDEVQIEIITAMFELFKKHSERPSQVCPRIEEIRKILRKKLHDS